MDDTNNSLDNRLMISIIVPVYNVEKYIVSCLDSLLDQNIESNTYEIICIDDGSTDNSGFIIDEYARKNNNIVVIHQQNKGVSYARNEGIRHAFGKYIWFIDSDDFIKSNSLKDVLNVLLHNDYDRLSVLPYAFPDEKPLEISKITTEMSQKEYKNFLWTMILKRDIIIQNNIWFEEDISYVEDAVFMLHACKYINECTTFSQIIYFYRLRKTGLMAQSDEKKCVNRIKAACVCKEIVLKKRDGDIESAYYFLYICVSKAMSIIAKMQHVDRKKYYSIAKKLSIFPLKYSKTYSPKSTTSTLSKKKKILYKLNDLAYMRIGYILLLVYWRLTYFKRWLSNQ